jgi:hypothetical protein
LAVLRRLRHASPPVTLIDRDLLRFDVKCGRLLGIPHGVFQVAPAGPGSA